MPHSSTPPVRCQSLKYFLCKYADEKIDTGQSISFFGVGIKEGGEGVVTPTFTCVKWSPIRQQVFTVREELTEDYSVDVWRMVL